MTFYFLYLLPPAVGVAVVCFSQLSWAEGTVFTLVKSQVHDRDSGREDIDRFTSSFWTAEESQSTRRKATLTKRSDLGSAIT